MINQTRRETVIKLLDSATENINLEDLFLFGLSPYYKEKLNDTFFSKQIEYQKDRDELKHSEKKISFASEQKEIYEQILDDTNDKLIISAPTSFGKTMLIKEYIYNEQPDSVVFVVPTNSLADELIDDFANIYTELGYTIYDTIKEDKAIQTKSIFIGTQEKFYQIYQGRNMSIDLFVIDEAYKLGDELNGSREVILNRTFVDTLNKAKRTILLLPLVNSIDGASHLNFKILKSDYSPVAKNFIKKNNSAFDSFIIKKIIENDGGRIYWVSTDQQGDFRVGDLFKIEQATGTATLNADAFNLSGLSELKLGSIGAELGAAINEFSTDETLGGNANTAVPTENAILGYLTRDKAGTGAWVPPTGTTSQRPVAGALFTGALRYNSSLVAWEGYNGSSWTGLGGGTPYVTIVGDGSTITVAESNQRFLVNTAAAVSTIQLPASPLVGDAVTFVDLEGTFAVNKLTIDRNSHDIMNIAEDMIAETNHAAFTLVYTGSANGWKLLEVA